MNRAWKEDTVIEIVLLLALGASFARFLEWLKNEYEEIDC
jgi:hypothetical protein